MTAATSKGMRRRLADKLPSPVSPRSAEEVRREEIRRRAEEAAKQSRERAQKLIQKAVREGLEAAKEKADSSD